MGNHRRFFIDPGWINEGEATITGDLAHQIGKVLRLKPGDHVDLLDGSGFEHEAELHSFSKDEIRALILRTTPCDTEPELNLTLAMCLPKGDKLDLIVQKCTELGISRMIAVQSERTVSRIDPAKVSDRLARWRRIAVEAAEQTGRARAPEIYGLMPFESVGDAIRAHDLSLLAWEEEDDLPLRNALRGRSKEESIMLIVGPEGGLTEREAALARDAGAKCVSLGRRVLRCETAAIAACAAILYEIEGEL